MNMNSLMQQAQRMQQEVEAKKREINATEFIGTAGGGMVEVVMMGDRTLKNVKFKPEIVDPDDIEMLEDLTLAALNDAVAQITKKEAEAMPNMSGLGL